MPDGGTKSYKANGTVYNIPEKEVGSFLKDFPSATEINSFKIGRDTFDIPIAEVGDFIKENPNATSLFEKKNLGGNGQKNGGSNNGTTYSEHSKPEFQFDLPSPRDVALGQMSRPDETISKNIERTLTAADTQMHGAERKQARLDLAEKKKKAAPIAIDNAARKSLKIKGLNPNNAALLNKEKSKFALQLATGDADVSFDKDGNAGLMRSPGIFESFHDHMMNAINANKEAREFKNMTTQQRVEFANKKMQEIPSPYIGTKESNAASFTGLLGDVTPTLGLYGAAGATGGVIEATGGTTAIPLRPVMTFAFNAGSGANNAAMNNVLERYNIIRQKNPELPDLDAMAQAEKGEDIDRLAGIAETALFSTAGGGSLGKTTTGKLLKGIAKSGIDLGAKTSAVEFGRSLAQGEGGQNAYDKAIKKFEENAPVGSLLHATTAIVTGAMKAPVIIKNSLKHDVATKMPQEEVQSLLQKNVEEGNITQEQADKVSGDIKEFRTALDKVPDGLPEDAQASVAGLILKRDNLKKEAELKDESAKDIHNQEIESINNQIKEIYRTGKPLEHEINEATGEPYKQPTFDEVQKKRVEDLADKIASGKRIEDAEDLQTEANFPQELEKQLQRLAKEETSANKDKEKPNTEVSKNVDKYLKQQEKEQPEVQIQEPIVADNEVSANKEAASDTKENLDVPSAADANVVQNPSTDKPVDVPLEDKKVVQVYKETGKILGLSDADAEAITLIRNSTHLSDTEKNILHRQYRNGTMSLKDIQKYTTVDVSKINEGEEGKWARAVLKMHQEKNGDKKINAEDIDFEEIPQTLSNTKPVDVPLDKEGEKNEFKPMLKENGEPKVFYHSSDGDFSEIKGQDSEGYTRKHSVTNRGIYFHEAPPQMAQYGKNKYEAHLDIKNPFIINNRTYVSEVVNPYTGKNIEVEHINSDDIKYLKEQGYDAVMAKFPAFQTVVFEPSQVKLIKKNGEQISAEKQIKQDVPLVDKETETPPPIEPPKEEVRPTYSEYPSTSLSYSGTGKLETEFGITEREPTKTKHDIETIKEADNLLEKGWKVSEAIDKIEKGEHVPSDAEYINMTRYAAELAQRLRDTDVTSPEYDKTLRELNRVASASNVAGKEQGRALGIRGRFKTVKDGTYEDFMLGEMDANRGADLTTTQKETAVKDFDEYSRLQKEADEKISKLEAENAKLKAEAEHKKNIKSTNKPATKKHEDLVKEREEIFTSIKDKLRKARGETSAIVLPYAKELIAIAPDVIKLARNLVEDGVLKLEDIVKNIHEQLKPHIEQIQEKDVHDILAGEYREKKPTKSEVAAQMQNIRTQAKLINTLEKKMQGINTKTEKGKQQKEQVLEELRQKIKDYDRENPDYEAQLKSLKKKNEKEFERLKEKSDKGDFEPEVKRIPLVERKEIREKYPDLVREVIASKDALIKKKKEIEIRRARQLYKNRSPQDKFGNALVRALNVPRTLMASMDFSAPLRQGIIASTSHPILSAKAAKFMFQAAKSEKVYNRWIDEVHNSPRWDIAEKTKLSVTDPNTLHLKEKEEAFLGSSYAEQIPIAGGLVKGSERAYVGFLNKIRWDLFNQYADAFEANGKTYENSPDLYKGLASFVNSSTGRGGMSLMENAAPVLNVGLFSPRLIASRMNMLGLTDIPNLATRIGTLGKRGVNYGFYSQLPKEIRIAAAKDMIKFIGVGLTTLALAKYAFGANVESDPRSSDFGKIRSGNTRWDIWGGFQPYARLLTQVIKQQSKSTTTGKVYELDGRKFGGRTVGDQMATFGRGKLSPIFGTIGNIITGRTLDQKNVERRFDIPFYAADNPAEGNITLTDELFKNVTPLLINDVKEAMQDRGVSALFTTGIPSTFGIGVQTYQPKVSSSTQHTMPKMKTPKEPKMPTLK